MAKTRAIYAIGVRSHYIFNYSISLLANLNKRFVAVRLKIVRTLAKNMKRVASFRKKSLYYSECGIFASDVD